MLHCRNSAARIAALCLVLFASSLSSFAQDPAKPAQKNPVLKALDEKVPVEFLETPLSDVVEYLQDYCKIAVALDTKALDDEGLNSGTPVTLKLTDWKLRKVLNHICRDLGLVWVPQGDLLLITTKTEADQILETRVYDVRDLYDYDLREQKRLSPEIDETGTGVDADSLIDLITSSVVPTSWPIDGGGIVPFGGTLVVSQNYAAHEKIGEFLAKLRGTLCRRDGKTASKPFLQDSTAAVAKALEERTSLDFKERPLVEIVDYLVQKHRLNVRLDVKALDDEGISRDTPVTLSLRSVQLGTALRAWLKQIGLTCIVVDDELVVTTKTEADMMVYPDVYDVHDLVNYRQLAVTRFANPADDKPEMNNYNSLIRVVTSTFAPSSWSRTGGPGNDAPYLGTITFAQTQEIHAQIAELLAKLRAAHKQPIRTVTGEVVAIEQPKPADPNALELRVYKLHWGLDDPPQKESPTKNADKPAAEKRDAAKPGSDTLNQFGGAGHGGAGLGGGSGTSSVGRRPSPESLRYTEEVGRTIVALIEPQRWLDNGGTGILRAVPSSEYNVAGTLVIRQTAAVHKQIAKLLRDLQDGGGGGFGGGGFF